MTKYSTASKHRPQP